MESPSVAPVSNRLLTIPNVISLIRLCCIPYFIHLVFVQDRETAAAVLLAVLGATDWIDGWIARRFNQVSAVGKFVDPAADRLLLVVAAVTIIVRDAMPLWFGLLAGLREAMVIAGGIVLATKGIKGLEVEYVGKAGAFFLMFSLPLFLVAHSGVSWHTEALVAAWVFGVPGIVLNYVSAFHYYKRSRIILSGHEDTYHPKTGVS
jgi:cardiolipin synthase